LDPQLLGSSRFLLVQANCSILDALVLATKHCDTIYGGQTCKRQIRSRYQRNWFKEVGFLVSISQRHDIFLGGAELDLNISVGHLESKWLVFIPVQAVEQIADLLLVCWASREDPGRPIYLPRMKIVQKTMQSRSRSIFPAVIFNSIAFHVLVCIVGAWVFLESTRVFVQRDDGESNIRSLRNLYHTILRWRRRRSVVDEEINLVERHELIPPSQAEGSNIESVQK
jgi:hypothetical protein